MKKAVGIVAFLVIMVWMFFIAGTIETHYNRDARCVEVTADTITFDDGDEIWEVYNDGANDIHVGDHVVMKMFTNHTDDTIYDDVVEGWRVR